MQLTSIGIAEPKEGSLAEHTIIKAEYVNKGGITNTLMIEFDNSGLRVWSYGTIAVIPESATHLTIFPFLPQE